MKDFLTAQEVKNFKAAHSIEKERRRADRIKAILLLNDDLSYPDIAKILHPEPERWQAPAAPPEYRPPQPEYRLPPEPQPKQREPETITAYAVEAEQQYDNSLAGFFHGKAHFWFALCIYYLGGVVALYVATVALGTPLFMLFVGGGWAFVGLFLLLWNAKNLEHDSGKWLARIVIVLILLSWIGAAAHAP